MFKYSEWKSLQRNIKDNFMHSGDSVAVLVIYSLELPYNSIICWCSAFFCGCIFFGLRDFIMEARCVMMFNSRKLVVCTAHHKFSSGDTHSRTIFLQGELQPFIHFLPSDLSFIRWER